MSLYNDRTDELLAEKNTRGKDVRFRIRGLVGDQVPCEVRAESGGLSDVHSVANAPASCDDVETAAKHNILILHDLKHMTTFAADLNTGHTREPWADEPKCSSCHSGHGSDTVGALAYDPADPAATPIELAGSRFAENPGTLYRNSLDNHAGIACHVFLLTAYSEMRMAWSV